MILQRIEEIIFSGYREKVSGNSFELIEDSKSAKCKKAIILKSEDVLVYKFDKEPKKDGIKIADKFPFFNSIEGVKSMADFILFYVRNGRLFIIICNLKSDGESNSSNQIKAAKIFANFLFETAKRKYEQDFRDVNPEFVPVLYSSKSLNKGTLKPGQIPTNKRRNFVSYGSYTDKCDLDVICN
jgi:hypothetical protein